MNNLRIFENSEFGEIRTITKDNEPMFCLMDICKALDMKNPTMVASRLEDDEVTKFDLGSKRGETNFVTESGLYAVILRSDKPNAKKFRKWVTGEVLPSIRKNGGYIANQENLTPEQIVANALVVAQNIITQKDKQIEEMKPKANYFDALVDKKLNTNIRDTAKELGVGEKAFVSFLIEKGYVYIAESPLFEITTSDKTYFAYDENEKTKILKMIGNKKFDIQRSKGLGENEAEMMSLTTMDPATRRLIKIEPDDIEQTQWMFDMLLGDDLQGRKDFITNNGVDYLDMADIS